MAKKAVTTERRAKLVFVLWLVVIMLLTACSTKQEGETARSEETSQESLQEADSSEAQKTEDSAKTTEPFGEFKSMTLSGEEVTQEVFAQADLTMVNIWGTFCSPCINEMPDLGELSRDYADRGFQMIGMLCDVEEPGDETALKIVDTTQADYMHIVASEDLTNGILSQVYAVPTTIFVDKDGKQVGVAYSGAQDKTTWKLIIEKMLVEVQQE